MALCIWKGHPNALQDPASVFERAPGDFPDLSIFQNKTHQNTIQILFVDHRGDSPPLLLCAVA